MQVVGIGIFMGGAGLVVWARRSLRRSYSPHLAVRPGQVLVETGPYRHVRHPAYGGLLLMALGVAVGYSSAIGLAAIPLLLIPGLVFRIRREERLLTARFGEVYAAYARRTPISDIQVTDKFGFEQLVRVRKLSYLLDSVPYMFMDLS